MKYDNTNIHLNYEKGRKLPDETMKLWMDALTRHIPRNRIKTIVDLGCGTGRFINSLAEYFSAMVLGIDPSIKMLTKVKADPISSFALAQGSAETLCITANSTDLVFTSQAYHHFQDKNKAISEIKRILRVNGYLCIRNSTVENLDSCPYLKFFPRAYKDDHNLLPSRKDVMNLMDGHGFKKIAQETINYKLTNNIKECYERTKLRAVTDLAQLTDDEFQEGLRKFKSYCEENDSNAPVYEDMDLFIYKKP